MLGPRQVHTHKHVIGLTGQGKSKLLASLFVQLHTQGIACALIDPHTDLASDVLATLLDRGAFVAPEADARLWYVDFARPDAYLPFNVLAQPDADHTVALNVAEACMRAWPALADGAAPQFENVFLAAALTLIQNKLPLTAMPRLLTDPSYRARLLQRVTDPVVADFFRYRFDRWGKEQPLMIESTLRRVFLLTFAPSLRYTLGQRTNVLDFRRHLDQGISVIYNLGGLPEPVQRLLGCLLTVGYEAAALARADTPAAQRRPYHLITDEFTAFAARSEEALARVLSAARKYGLFLTLAHQTWSQVSDRLQGALQNTAVIAFKLGRADAEWAAPRFGRFDADVVKHLVADPSARARTHPLYVSLSEARERWTQALEDLHPREAFIHIGGQTTKIWTRTVPSPRCSRAELRALMHRSAHRLLVPAHRAIAAVDGQRLTRAAPLPRRARAG